MKKVSADTIRELTVSSGFSARLPSTPPSTEQMIDQIRTKLAEEVDALALSVKRSKESGPVDPKAPPNAFEISYRRALQGQKDFELIVSEVPKGFRLTPVLYSKIDRDQNTAVYDEFSKHVRRHFLRYVGEHHADELTALGICQHGIERMKKGLDAADVSDMLYDTSIDHIIERSGGGKMSLQKAVDPLLPPGSAPTYLVNHMSNLILLPEQVHKFKNILNDIQHAAQTRYNDSRWILMLIPEVGPGQSGFVATPQDPQHILHGVELRQQDVSTRISHAAFVADQVQESLRELYNNKTMNHMQQAVKDIAQQQNKKVVELIEEEIKSPTAPQKLTRIFNEAVSKEPERQDLLETFLKPAIQDMGKHLRAAFDTAIQKGSHHPQYADFVSFYKGKKLNALRENVTDMPLKEAAELTAEMKKIDKLIQKSPPPPPANDNTDAPRKHRKHSGGHKPPKRR